jgi:hypothetical protein
MLDESEWGRNVGTAAFPVTFLHEYAVGLIWDWLNSNTGPVELPTLEGELSENVLDGVDKVIIPDNLNAVAGYVPDILCLHDSRPIRLIEVVVTSPVTVSKTAALTNLGVEVIQVPVRNEDELMALFPSAMPNKLRWWPSYNRGETVFEDVWKASGVNWKGTRQYKILNDQEMADKAIKSLIGHLVRCSPSVRRDFLSVLRGMGSLESLYPLRLENPKYESLHTEL